MFLDHESDGGLMLMVSDAERLDMHTKLRENMGVDVADTLMAHLPPVGWGDVARKADIDRLDSRIDQVDKRIDQLEKNMNDKFEMLNSRISTIITVGVALFAAQFAFDIHVMILILRK